MIQRRGQNVERQTVDGIIQKTEIWSDTAIIADGNILLTFWMSYIAIILGADLHKSF